MRFTPRAALGMLTLLAMTAIPACSDSHHDSVNLVPATTSPIADVPVPVGFSMNDASTSKVEASGLRFVDHKYDGSDDVLPVIRFYKDQMPAKGWTFVSQNQLVHNEISLHYTKGSEDCTVTVTPGSFHTHIRVQIDPAGRNAAH
ncbi:MAG TPA: hypothetical protein VM008_18920 [Phycisphaerae bacterium]|nr:hypothetical protein [Phycisphaerae bacterium]